MNRRSFGLSLLALVGSVSVAALLGDSQRPGAQPSQESSGVEAPIVATVSEKNLRTAALRKPLPMYPASSVAAHISGVAVADVTVGLAGRVETVKMLQAPDARTGEEVNVALRQWMFAPASTRDPLEQGARIKLRGKLTFYFRIADGKGAVLNPEDIIDAIRD